VSRQLRNIILLILGIVLVAGLGLLVFNRGMGEILALEIAPIELAGVPAGVYQGSFSQNRWSYQVEVQVGAGVLEDIIIVSSMHDAIVGKWNEQVVQEILQKQSLDIQGVSGATVTTKALQKAVQNAIK
jgi:uncharacterized protein with FMN-binding domain